jgi:hypothetical protein
MIVNIYKEEKLFISLTGNNNPLSVFFINKESINEYKIIPNPADKNRYLLKYSFNNIDYLVDNDNSISEAILNNYRVEITED